MANNLSDRYLQLVVVTDNRPQTLDDLSRIVSTPERLQMIVATRKKFAAALKDNGISNLDDFLTDSVPGLEELARNSTVWEVIPRLTDEQKEKFAVALSMIDRILHEVVE